MKKINQTVVLLKKLRKNKGRLFIIGVGGSAECFACRLMILESYVT